MSVLIIYGICRNSRDMRDIYKMRIPANNDREVGDKNNNVPSINKGDIIGVARRVSKFAFVPVLKAKTQLLRAIQWTRDEAKRETGAAEGEHVEGEVEIEREQALLVGFS